MRIGRQGEYASPAMICFPTQQLVPSEMIDTFFQVSQPSCKRPSILIIPDRNQSHHHENYGCHGVISPDSKATLTGAPIPIACATAERAANTSTLRVLYSASITTLESSLSNYILDNGIGSADFFWSFTLGCEGHKLPTGSGE